MGSERVQYSLDGSRNQHEVLDLMLDDGEDDTGLLPSDALDALGYFPTVGNMIKRMELLQATKVDRVNTDHRTQAMYAELFSRPVPHEGLKAHRLSHLPPFASSAEE